MPAQAAHAATAVTQIPVRVCEEVLWPIRRRGAVFGMTILEILVILFN